MNDTVKKSGCNVEPYNYRNDFRILTPKEKSGILKNVKHLLKLQKDNDAILSNAVSCEKVEIV